MPMTYLVTSLIGLLTGTMFRAAALIIVSGVLFFGALVGGIVSGNTVLASIGTAFSLSFVLQISYLAGAMLVIGKGKIAKRITLPTLSHRESPRRS